MINVFPIHLNNEYDVFQWIMMFIHFNNYNYQGINIFNVFACLKEKKNLC